MDNLLDIYKKKYKKFFENVWDGSFGYLIMSTKECCILNELFLTLSKDKKINKKIIYMDEILLYSEELAKHYFERGYFPSLVFCDVIAADFVQMTKLIYELRKNIERILIDLDKNKELSKVAKDNLWVELGDSISISLYDKPHEIYILDFKSFHSVNSINEKYSDEINQSIKELYDNLNGLYLPQNNESMSIEILNKPNKLNNWKNVLCSYRGKKCEMFLNPNSIKNNFIPILYITKQSDGKEYMESVTLFGDIKKQDFDLICSLMLKEFQKNQNKYKKIISFLEKKDLVYQATKNKILLLILSVINIYDYCSCNEKNIKVFNFNDLSYGLKKELNTEIKLLYEDIELINSLKQILYFNISELAEPILLNEDLNYSDINNEKINSANEFIFYKKMIEYKNRLHLASINTINFQIEKNDYNTIKLNDSFFQTKELLKSADINTIDLIISQILLLNYGLGEYNLVYNEESEKIQFVLKINEYSLFYIPRKFEPFFMALSLIERESIKQCLNTNEVLKEFVDYININDEDLNNIDKYNLECLKLFKLYGKQFIDEMYSCGISMGSWDIMLTNHKDYNTSNLSEAIKRNSKNNEVKYDYFEQAKLFINNYSKKRWR